MSRALRVGRSLHRKRSRSCSFRQPFRKARAKQQQAPSVTLVIGGATTFKSPTFSSLEGLPLRLPTHDLTPGCGMQALLFLIFKCNFTLYSFAAYKISYFTVTDLLGKGFFHCGTACCMYIYIYICLVEIFAFFFFYGHHSFGKTFHRRIKILSELLKCLYFIIAFSREKCISLFTSFNLIVFFPSTQAKLQKETSSTLKIIEGGYLKIHNHVYTANS